LPFAEDLRQYPMHTLSVGKMRQSFQPSQAQLDAAEELILALDLTAADENGEKHERYACTETYNPITQYMIQTLQEAVVNPGFLFLLFLFLFIYLFNLFIYLNYLIYCFVLSYLSEKMCSVFLP
jgi:hypothetical protein